MTSSSGSPGQLVELDESECWEILREHSVGRIAWVVEGRPHIVPVNFLVHDGRIWVRSTPYSQLAQHSRERHVAFEVDEIDGFTRSGTSVVVEGVAEQKAAYELDREVDELQTWAAGNRPFVIGIDVKMISGRRVMPT